MQLLQAHFGGLELDPSGSKVNLEFDFDTKKTFEFALVNPSPTDEIKQLEFVTSLPRDAYTIDKDIKKLDKMQKGIMHITVDSDKIIEFSKKNPTVSAYVGFNYLRVLHFGG